MKKNIIALFADFFQIIGIAAAIFILFYFFIFRIHQVFGHSMEPNFHDQEYVVTDILSYKFREPVRGEVIVLKSPTDPNKDFIKRIIGLPNETLKIENSSVFVNGKRLDEGLYLDDSVKTYTGSFLKEGKEVKIAPDSYIVFGDNRNNSSDSREWGPLRKKDIVGRPFLVIWPPNVVGPILSVDYAFP